MNEHDKEAMTILKNMMYDFLSAFHGDRPFEIRYVPDGHGFGYNISVLRKGQSFYRQTQNGLEPRGTFSPEGIYDYIANELYLFVGDSSPFFTVNSPNADQMTTCVATDNDIRFGGKVNAQFVDVDAPKEIRVDQTLLDKWKEKMRKRILRFKFRPSFVIETKHGYHVYWLLEDGQLELFRHIQMQLIQHFDGDESCVNESRVMRLPGFSHRKDPKHPFPLRIQIWNPVARYKQEDLKQVLPELTDKTLHQILRNTQSNYVPVHMAQGRRKDVLSLLMSKIDIVRESPNKLICHCCMPNHEDHHPSAWIDMKYMWFHCSGCGTHMPIDELAEQFDWQDVIQELGRYDTDIDIELERIEAAKKQTPQFPHRLDPEQTEIAEKVIDQVTSHFDSLGQTANLKHQQYIRQLVYTLALGDKSKTYLVPLDMGGGKSTILKFWLVAMMRQTTKIGAIVAVERNDTIRKFVNELNLQFGDEIAFKMHGFEAAECLWNERDMRGLTSCAARRHPYHCPYKNECRYYLQFEQQNKYPIVVISFKRMDIDFDELQSKYQKYTYKGESGIREKLLIDEKPFLINVDVLSEKQFDHFAKELYNNALVNSKNGNIPSEMNDAISLIKPLYATSDKREIISPTDRDFRFSSDFWSLHRKTYLYNQAIYRIPEGMESIIRNGGHRSTNSHGEVVISTSNYRSYANLSAFQTLIFDGTADIDLDYNHEEYHLFDFQPLRSYEALEFYICDTISASMTSFEDTSKVSALCQDVKRILNDNPNDTIYFPVFSKIEEQVVKHLNAEIESGKIIVAHYGATRGSNRFRICSIVVLGGILHKGEHYYIEKAKTIYGQRGVKIEDIESTKVGSSRRFNEKMIEQVKVMSMLVDYSQEIKRTSQRDNTKNVRGKVYIFHNDRLLLERIRMKFPGSKVTNWAPRTVVETKIRSKKNNGSQQALLELITDYREAGRFEVSYEEIGERLNINDAARNKLLNSVGAKSLFAAYNIRSEKEGRNKKLVWDK